MRPGWRQRIVRLALRDQDPDHDEAAAFVAMHQVHFQRNPGAVEQMFTAMVDMELQQVVIHAVDNDAISGLRGHLDRVAGVLHSYARPAVVELVGV